MNDGLFLFLCFLIAVNFTPPLESGPLGAGVISIAFLPKCVRVETAHLFFSRNRYF